MLSSGCDVHECRVLLLEGVRIGEHADISHPDVSQPDGRGGRFNFPGQTYPDLLIALTRRVFSQYTVPRCSLEAS